jgi:hypothetical protein
VLSVGVECRHTTAQLPIHSAARLSTRRPGALRETGLGQLRFGLPMLAQRLHLRREDHDTG